MPESSGPISQGTTAERQFTDVQWRDLFGDEPGVLSDMDGTAYALNLGGGGDVVSVGSTTQASLARVAGFVHRIPQSSPQTITIPAASGSTRTDIIALRYDPAFTGLPGPVRLTRIAGSSASVPAYDASPPGVEDLPLWSITRAVGQALSLATVTRMFPRLSPLLDLPVGQPLPTSSPLGTVVRQGARTSVRQIVSGSPAWVQDPVPSRFFERTATPSVSVPATTSVSLGTFVTSETTSAIQINAQFRAGSTNTVGVCRVKVNGSSVALDSVARNQDISVPVNGTINVGPGTHSLTAEVQAIGTTTVWESVNVNVAIGSVE